MCAALCLTSDLISSVLLFIYIYLYIFFIYTAGYFTEISRFIDGK